MISVNKLLQAVKSETPVIAPSVWTGSPQIIELVGQLGFECLVLECEHSPYSSYESLETQCRAAQAGGMTTIASIPRSTELAITKVCETGVTALIVAHTGGREDAERITRAAKYPPVGRRGAALSVRQVGYALERAGWPARADEINADTVLLGKVEDPEALDNLDEILDTDIDGLFFGAFDMSHGIARILGDPGIRGQIDHPRVLEARDLVLAKSQEHGKFSGAVLSQLQAQENRPARELVQEFAARRLLLFTLPSELELLQNAYRASLVEFASL